MKLRYNGAARGISVLLVALTTLGAIDLSAQTFLNVLQRSDAVIGAQNGGPIDGPAMGGIPPNSTCEGATLEPLAVGSSLVRMGDNTGAPPHFIFGIPLVWEGFSTTECANITISYCGTSPAFQDHYPILGQNCPLTNYVNIPAADIETISCGDGNFTIVLSNLSPGVYYYPVRMEPGTSEGPYTLTISASACTDLPPANASCTGAVALTIGEGCTPTSGSTANATVTGTVSGGCQGGDPSDGVWYSFVATGATHVVSVDPSSQFNAVVDVFSAPCAGGSLLDCVVAANLNINIDLTLNGLTTGETYYIRVYDWYAGISATTDFTVCVTGLGGDPCEAVAGTVTADMSDLCLIDGSALLTATAGGDAVVPTGFELLYVLTQGVDLVIVDTGSAPSFEVTETGIYTIHTLVYDPLTLDLSGIVVGTTTGGDVNGMLIQGGGSICASLDVAGAAFNVADVCCDADAGTLIADQDTVCFVDDAATVRATMNGDAVVPQGFTQVHILTSGEDFVLQQIAIDPLFVVTSTGLYTLHTLVYDSSTLDLGMFELGVATIAELDATLLQGGGTVCAGLDLVGAPVIVELCCDAVAGTLIADISSVCLLNGTATISATPNGVGVVPAGFTTIHVLTSGNGLVIVQAGPDPSFEVTSAGLYRIHTLVYDSVTLDLDIIEFGVTTAGEVHALLIQGAGMICASLDLAGAAVAVIDCSPTNDDCSNAIELPINAIGNCPDAGFEGDNTYATQEAGEEPSCDGTVAFFADVWYSFNSGDNTEVTIDLDPRNMTDWGFTVADACTGGNELACEITPAGPVVVATAPNTTYWIRVYSNIQFGNGGAFGLCLSGEAPTFVCNGGTVAISGGSASVMVCSDAEPDELMFVTNSTSVENFVFVLTNANDSIVSVLAGDMLDFNTLPLGTYHVWGISYNGDLSGAEVDSLVSSVTSTGGCVSLSSSFVNVMVDICSGLGSIASSEWNLYPNPTNGEFNVRYAGQTALVRIDVIDMEGRIVLQEQATMAHGEVYNMSNAGRTAPGMYTVRLSSGITVKNMRLIVR